MIDCCTYIYRYIQVSVRDITLECLQITPTKFRGSTFPGNMHNYIWWPYYLPRFMKFCCIKVFTVFRLLTDFVCLYNYEFWLSLCKIVRSSVILLLPLFRGVAMTSCFSSKFRKIYKFKGAFSHKFQEIKISW
jgi:hypothetical protein